MEAEQETGVETLEPVNALQLLQSVYRNPTVGMTTRMRAAMACLPFEAPKLAVTAVVSEQDFATVLDRRLKRIEEMRTEVIEAKPAQIEAKPNPMPRIADKRYRRI
jgi:hypothetical protein